jgi:hypothetical protein
VNNSEQFAAHLVDRVAKRSVEHLRVHVQRRIDVGVTHQLRDDFAGHASIVRPPASADDTTGKGMTGSNDAALGSRLPRASLATTNRPPGTDKSTDDNRLSRRTRAGSVRIADRSSA